MADRLRRAERPHLDGVVTEYEAALKIAIRLHDSPRPFARPRDEPGFHIHFFALPRRFPWLWFIGDAPMQSVPVAFGHALHETARLTLSLPRRMTRGVVLRHDDGKALAYLYRRNVFVLFDLARQVEALAAILLRHVFDHAFDQMLPDLAIESGLHPERIRLTLASLRKTTLLRKSLWEDERRQAARRRFHEAKWERAAEEIAFLEAEIRTTEEEVEAASARVLAETRHVRACRNRLAQLRGELTRREPDPAREFDSLCELPDVADVATLPDGLRLVTRPIVAEHRGRRHAMGTFQIDLGFNGEITMRNLTNRHGYYDHPHIWDGKPCLGNIRAGLAKLIGELELTAAAEVLLDFLKTINPRDWHVSIEHWREAPDPSLATRAAEPTAVSAA
jgi:hypothetical protein